MGRLPTCCRAAEACSRLLNPSRKVRNTRFATSPPAPSIVSCSERRWCMTQLGARAPLKTVRKKLFAAESRPCKTSCLAGAYGTADVVLNGGHDGPVLLAGTERTTASCYAAQRDSFRILSDLQLHRIDELGFNHSSRADAVLLSRGVDEHRLMNAGAESALQARSCSRLIAS